MNLFTKFALFATASLLSQQLIAQPGRQTVASKIEKATVFITGGQVQRTARTPLPKGKTELVFKGISPNIDKQSIQVKGEGEFTILSVVHQLNFLQEQAKQQEISELEVRQEKLTDRIAVERSVLSVYKREEEMLVKNQQLGGGTVNFKTAELREAVDFQRARLTEVMLKQIEIEKSIKKLEGEIKQLANQLTALNQKKDLSTSEIIVTVLAKESTTANFTLTYYVQNAGWFVTYDLRVNDISRPIDLALKANVYQSSGEDWQDVKLTLSNGNPTENGVSPNLEAWYLRFGNYARPRPTAQSNGEQSGKVTGRVMAEGEPVPGASVVVRGTTIGTATDADGRYSLQLPAGDHTLVFSFIGYTTQERTATAGVLDVDLESDAQELSEVVVTSGSFERQLRKKAPGVITIRGSSSLPLETKTSYQPTTISFDIAEPYTVLNDGKTYSVDIKTLAVPAQYEYTAVPKLAESAFLTAKISNWQDLNLLDGEVNLFFEGAFLGKSILDVQNAGDTLSVSLGADKGIVVEREPLKQFSQKQFLSNSKVETRAFEIRVRNNKRQAVRLIVEDQFPISTNNDIDVTNQEYKEGELDEASKKVTWKFELGPRQEKKVGLKYAVKYPKNQVVILE